MTRQTYGTALSNFETWPKFNFGKPGDFKTGPCNLAGSGFETGSISVPTRELPATPFTKPDMVTFGNDTPPT
ncbi:hypothetical protein BGY98DRAFT_996737 [Russula aff. rugulosa BPL654]|nr:hypothetical protein BGY98DRAFT_996737 [Russula aff. rugulosa BPL654]